MSLLQAQGLHSGYQRIPIVMGVDLAVAEGEFVGILGHNGMGKTTLMKTLIGALPATAGSIRFAGADITRMRTSGRARRGLGYVPQGREIFPRLSVRENLAMAVAGARQPDKVIDEVLADFPRLTPLLDRAGGVLSGGEQQILALARCLCGRPQLVLLDEPTEGIQPSIIDEMIETLLALRRRGALAMVLVEQNLHFIQALSDRVLLLHRGRIRADVSPDRIGATDLGMAVPRED